MALPSPPAVKVPLHAAGVASAPRTWRAGAAWHLDVPGRRVHAPGATPNATLATVAQLSQPFTHVSDLVSVDFCTMPTATFSVLFVFIVPRHDRQRIVRFTVTDDPCAEWTAQHIVEACPRTSAPRSQLRDRDRLYDPFFTRRVAGLGVQQLLTAPRSPWQMCSASG